MKTLSVLSLFFFSALFYNVEAINRRSTAACVVEEQQYFEGESFVINTDSGCSFNCTCMIVGDSGRGNCTKQCEDFSYPAGCEPQRDSCGCNMRDNYLCPTTTCRDEAGVVYEEGDSFTNNTCNCTCTEGLFQCLCQRACVVGGQQYIEGESFVINTDSGCSFDCTCMIVGGSGIGDCTKQCEEFSYPAGCEPQRDSCGCNMRDNYVCPTTTCNNEAGVVYNEGESFTNSTCNCTCTEGLFQCQCQRACVVGGQEYFEGEEFQLNTEPGCSFDCTCMIVGDGGIGNCTKQCEEFSYPAGCEPQRDSCGCHMRDNYVCPTTTCNDEAGVAYEEGDSFTNGTCNCTCTEGLFHCQCEIPVTIPVPVLFPNVTNRSGDGPCIREDDTVLCKFCFRNASGFVECSEHKKCEQWPFQIFHKFFNRTINMTCTCYGPLNYSKCRPNLPGRRKRFANSEQLSSEVTFHTLKRGTSIMPALTSQKLIRVPTK